MTNPDDPAFEPLIWKQMPLTKREYFAAMAMIARSIVPNSRLIYDYTREAVEMADALIAELNKGAK